MDAVAIIAIIAVFTFMLSAKNWPPASPVSTSAYPVEGDGGEEEGDGRGWGCGILPLLILFVIAVAVASSVAIKP